MSIPSALSSRFANMGVVCAVLVVSQHVGEHDPEGTLSWYIVEGIRSLKKYLPRIATVMFGGR